MAERRKVKFLTAIWGARYVEEFCHVALPSFLAPGNLPHLAAETDLEVLVMTSAASIPAFEAQPLFQHLRMLCPVRFILIDDLIASALYGVTLTLAYARGIQDSGEAQTNTHFVFMNADFVLADGALATLLRALREGHRCIMAPSLRASAESTLPHLMAAVDGETGTLAMPPRQMVRLCFEHLHPTVVAKTVTQNFVTCSTHNQVYWQVDENTLLARHYLIFMLAITPEKPLGAVNSYCDYGFVPEMVPSGEFTVLGDSDEFFMLELQPAAQEKGFLSCGAPSIPKAARDLSTWTTAEHRRFAEAEIVFRTGDLPPGYDAARRGLAEFMGRLQAQLGQPPVSHVDHFYWVLGVEAWAMRRPDPGAPLPPEMSPILAEVLDASARRAGKVLGTRNDIHPDYASAAAQSPVRRTATRGTPLQQFLGQFGVSPYVSLLRLAQRLAGKPPNVPLWHHLWLDSRLQIGCVEELRAAVGSRNLLVCDPQSGLPGLVGRTDAFDVVLGVKEFAEGTAELAGAGRQYDSILLHLYRSNVRQSRAALEAAGRLLAPGGTVALYIEHARAEEDPSNFSQELAQYVDSVLPGHWLGHSITARFAGGGWKRRLRLLERALIRQLLPLRWWRAVPIAVAWVGWPVVALATAANNWLNRDRAEDCPPFCTSALLLIRWRRGEAGGRA